MRGRSRFQVSEATKQAQTEQEVEKDVIDPFPLPMAAIQTTDTSMDTMDTSRSLEEHDEDVYVLIQPKVKQQDSLKVSETIVIYEDDVWQPTMLLSINRKFYQRSSYYWNFASLDGSYQRGSYLCPGEAWGVLRGEDLHRDLQALTIIIPRQTSSVP
jgi:hypothetical protein